MARQQDLYLEPYPGAGKTGLEPGFRQGGFVDPGPPPPPPNLYDDLQFWTDNTEFPNNYRLMDQSAHPERYEHAYWLSAGEKSEMTTEWLKIYQPTYGGISMNISTVGGWQGFYMVRNGRYLPSMVYAGYVTNTDDWSVKYDAVRGFLWNYWTNSNPSDQQNYQIAQRATRGSANFGEITLAIDRNFTSKWRVAVSDGNGNTTNNYLAGVPTCEGDACALQWEFVKGAYVKLRLYQRVTNLDFSTFVAPTWPIATSGYYVSVDLSGAELNQLTPVTPNAISASSVEASNGRIARYAYELRGIGNDWAHLI